MKTYLLVRILLVKFALITLASMAEELAAPIYQEIVEREIHADRTNSEESLKKPYVVLVSLDGFRHDYAEMYGASTLLDMRKQGASVKKWMPSFPSKTFPNHYTLATGLYPAKHGIVSNTFYSRSRDETYSIGNRSAVEDGTWYGGVPIWNLAESQGMLSASFFWVGSEADIQKTRPSRYYRFDSSIPYELRVDRAIDWLNEPEATRPHMITLYFSAVDSYGHRTGPESEGTREAVLRVDHQIARLREGIKASGLPVTLIVTSDHGMTEVSDPIAIEDYVSLGESMVLYGPSAMIYTKNAAETDRIYKALSRVDKFRTYLGDSMPSYLHYLNQDRIGDIVLIADAPAVFTDGGATYDAVGTHGYDPYDHADMSGILYLEGPRIQPGYTIDAVENIHLYPLIAHLLDLEITTPIDGELRVLKPVLR
jgi:predicted AlkP superfamily pyrophosphatase or phosphodiesterase